MESARKMQENLVTQEVKAGEYQSYIAYPTEGKNLPGVIIIHEIFGFNDNIRSITRRFANAGYVALAVDMFSKDSNRRLCIMKTVSGLIINARQSAHMGALDGAVKFLQGQLFNSRRPNRSNWFLYGGRLRPGFCHT